jgi:Asp-tRNA(Asn)/Glu-tRNA(Gln) amidotransferase A subunit family amidase
MASNRPQTPRTPRISGPALRALALATRAAPTRALLAAITTRELGVDKLTALEPELRSPFPLHALPLRARASHERPTANLGVTPPAAHAPTSASLTALYRSGALSPRAVTARALDAARALGAHTPPMPAVLDFDDATALAAAEASAARWQRGAPLSPLDGVPITIKEQSDMAGLPTRLGTSYLAPSPATKDATVVARLRAAGAVLLGTSPMTEFGMTPVGYNPHRTMPRNPHDLRHTAGGSSTGAGVGVATGLVPVALGADGGGSIRTPAALNGVFGLKPTFGRISRGGDGFGGTVNHLGPLARSVHDLAVFLDAVSGEDPRDELTRGTAPSRTVDALGRGVRGLRIGIDDEEWRDADPEVARVCRDALAALEREGAVLVPIGAELVRHAAAIGYPTIGAEALAGLREARTFHADRIGDDLTVSLAVLSELDGDAYVDAQCLRATLRAEVARLLADVDVIALPTTAKTAPRATDDELRGGFVDPPVLDSLCRYAFLGNLTGLPAGTAPVGRDASGLPIGLQILGDAWDDACVLQVLAHLERIGAARVERPRVWVDITG